MQRKKLLKIYEIKYLHAKSHEKSLARIELYLILHIFSILFLEFLLLFSLHSCLLGNLCLYLNLYPFYSLTHERRNVVFDFKPKWF